MHATTKFQSDLVFSNLYHTDLDFKSWSSVIEFDIRNQYLNRIVHFSWTRFEIRIRKVMKN